MGAIIATGKFAVAMLLCQSLIGAVFVVGWTFRLVQRSVLKRWWQRSNATGSGTTFAEFLESDSATEAHRHWPNWIVQQNWKETWRRRLDESLWSHLRRTLGGLLKSLWLNLRIGFQGAANTTLFLLPGGVLMLFSWYDGWHNSFNKGYEQAFVGPSVGVLGIFFFIAAMLYVPLAQARQAVTGEWRAFYDFGLIWRLVRCRWAACLGLAALYSALMLPVTIVRAALAFLSNGIPNFAEYSNAQAIGFLNGYFFWCALWLFPAYVALRLAAGRIYAKGLLMNVHNGRTPAEMLRPFERAQLQRLNLAQPLPVPQRHPLVRVASHTSLFFLRAAAILAAVFLWFSLIAQLYVQQFINYIPGVGWTNHPLVQLPVIRFIPKHLTEKAGE